MNEHDFAMLLIGANAGVVLFVAILVGAAAFGYAYGYFKAKKEKE